MNGQTPDYLKTPTLSLHRHLYGIRANNVLKDIVCKTERYQHSFFPDSVSMWNDLGPELRGAESISVFKRKLLKLYRPVKTLTYMTMALNGFFNFELKSHKKTFKIPLMILVAVH